MITHINIQILYLIITESNWCLKALHKGGKIVCFLISQQKYNIVLIDIIETWMFDRDIQKAYS